MLDSPHTVKDSVLDRPGCVGVAANVRLINRGNTRDSADLLRRKLDAVDGVGRRADAAAAHNLNKVCAAPELVARDLQALVNAVAQAAAAEYVPAAAFSHIVTPPQVPVAASLGELIKGHEEPRPIDDAVLDRLLQGHRRAATVLSSSKASHNYLLGYLCRIEVNNILVKRLYSVEALFS